MFVSIDFYSTLVTIHLLSHLPSLLPISIFFPTPFISSLFLSFFFFFWRLSLMTDHPLFHDRWALFPQNSLVFLHLWPLGTFHYFCCSRIFIFVLLLTLYLMLFTTCRELINTQDPTPPPPKKKTNTSLFFSFSSSTL